ncbi:MAG: hypothetical protein M1540_08840 [Candidatus Bathyarchaeota archaeon]|nr:hypothetical protein [Candidatus Bathyarchaeota archaeon]
MPKRTRGGNSILSLSSQKKTRFSSAVFIIITLLVLTVFPVGFVFAQSGYWDITMQFSATSIVNESGASITVSMSGSNVLHLTVTGQQVSGSGNGNYAVSMSGSMNTGGGFGTISAPQVNIAETDSVSGTVGSDMIATLKVTVTATNAPSTLSGTITTTVAGQTVTTPISVPISSITQTTSGTYQVKLQDGYTVTTPISSSGGPASISGSTSISVTRTVNPSPTPSPTETYALGTVGLLRGSAAIMDPNTGQYTPLASDREISSGSIVRTTGDSVVEFRYPSGDCYVDLGADSKLQFVGIQQETKADGTLTLEAAVPPLPNEGYSGPYEEGLIDEGLGPLSWFLMGLGGAMHGFKGVVVEGLLYLLEGTAHFKGHSTDTDTHYYAEPVAIRQGYLVPMGTEYIVSVSNTGATINVITGPVVFVDWRSGNTVTIESGQSLTLPNAGQNGFSSQELQNYVSFWDSSSVDQWWASSNVNPALPFSWQIVFALAGMVAAIAIIAAVLVWRRRRKMQVQQLPIPPPPPPPPSNTFPNNCSFYMRKATRLHL